MDQHLLRLHLVDQNESGRRIQIGPNLDTAAARADRAQRDGFPDQRRKILEVPADFAMGHEIAQTVDDVARPERSEEHTSELQSLMRISYAVFCLKKKKKKKRSTVSQN